MELLVKGQPIENVPEIEQVDTVASYLVTGVQGSGKTTTSAKLGMFHL